VRMRETSDRSMASIAAAPQPTGLHDPLTTNKPLL
jgi:hypothetical protein